MKREREREREFCSAELEGTWNSAELEGTWNNNPKKKNFESWRVNNVWENVRDEINKVAGNLECQLVEHNKEKKRKEKNRIRKVRWVFFISFFLARRTWANVLAWLKIKINYILINPTFTKIRYWFYKSLNCREV